MHAPKNHPGINLEMCHGQECGCSWGRNQHSMDGFVEHSLGHDDRGPVTNDVGEFFTSANTYRNVL